MPREPVIGNSADELGQVDKGVDFELLNKSRLIEAPNMLDVDARREGNDVHLESKEYRPTGQHSVGAALQYTPAHQTLAEIVEVPEFTLGRVGYVRTSPERMMELSHRTRRESLVWYAITANQEMAALDLPPDSNGRVIVRMDTLESEYSCQHCRGLGYEEAEVCETCKGARGQDGIDCPDCQVLGYTEEHDQKWSCGHRPCASCGGIGWRGRVVIPQVAQGRPCTGVVVSLGPNTCILRLGDRVLYSKFAGHALTTPEHLTFTTMRESEVIALIEERRP